MKKFMFAFSLVLFLASIGLAGATMRRSDQSSSAQASAQKAEKTVSGEVVSIDTAKNELIIKDETGGEVRLMVSRSTRVMKEGKAITLADLKPSQKVVCEAEESAGAWAAKSILVST